MNETEMKKWQNSWNTQMDLREYKDVILDIAKMKEQDEYKNMGVYEGVHWEDFLSIVDAVTRKETPEWLILKGGDNNKRIADLWTKAIKENKKREQMERERIRMEEIKKTALSKLSAEEKKALGLK